MVYLLWSHELKRAPVTSCCQNFLTWVEAATAGDRWLHAGGAPLRVAWRKRMTSTERPWPGSERYDQVSGRLVVIFPVDLDDEEPFT